MATERQVIIRIDAAMGASVADVFKPLEKSHKQARQTAQREAKATTADLAKENAKTVSSAAKANTQIAAEFAKGEAARTAISTRENQKRLKEDLKAFDERIKASAKARSEEEKDIEAVAKKAERASARKIEAQKKEVISTARRVGSESLSNVGHLGRSALGLGKTIASGMGADFDIGSLIGKSTSLQKSITDTVNSGAVAKGQRANADDVTSATSAVTGAAASTATDVNAMGAAFQEFVNLTGNVDEAKGSLELFGKVARATGSDVTDVAKAGAMISKALGDVPDKAKLMEESLRLVTKQGAEGSLELRQLAPFMGRITQNAFQFEGSESQNIGKLGALAQLSMVGGKTNASEASNAAANWGRDLTKATADKNFKAVMGQDYTQYSGKNKTKIRDPEQMIDDVLAKTGGNIAQISKMFRNSSSKSVMMGAANIADQAGGGEAGREAVHKFFADLAKSMSHDDMESAAKLSMGGPEAAAVKLNNQLQLTAADLGTKLQPALEKLAPYIVSAADAFAHFVEWCADNPGTAITAAIIASIGKAALGEMVAGAMKNALSGVGSGADGLVGKFGGLAAASVALGVAFVAACEYLASKEREGANASLAGVLNTGNAIDEAKHAKGPGEIAASIRKLEADKQAKLAAIAGGKDYQKSHDEKNFFRDDWASDWTKGALNSVNSDWGENAKSIGKKRSDADPMVMKGNLADVDKDQAEIERLSKLSAVETTYRSVQKGAQETKDPTAHAALLEIAAALRTLDAKLGGTLTVKDIGDKGANGAPTVDGGNRTTR